MNKVVGLGARQTKKSRVEALLLRLANAITAPVPRGYAGWEVVSTTSRRKALSIDTKRTRDGHIRVFHVSQMFIDAPPAIFNDLVTLGNAWLRGTNPSPDVSARLTAWLTATHAARGAEKFAKRAGQMVHDPRLDDYLDTLIRTEVWGTDLERDVDWSKLRIGWETMRTRKGSQRLVLGRYHIALGGAPPFITINDRLRQAAVPPYVIVDTVWHEMMHHWQAETGRQLGHDAEFRNREALWSAHKSAIRWLGARSNLPGQRGVTNIGYLLGFTDTPTTPPELP